VGPVGAVDPGFLDMPLLRDRHKYSLAEDAHILDQVCDCMKSCGGD
jgi:hypothetical protein